MGIGKAIGTGGISIRRLGHVIVPVAFFALFLAGQANAAGITLQVLPQLDSIRTVLSQIGPALSAVLFIVAGVFYALGQVMPPDKKAHFHTTAVNIIIGAIVIGVLSVASTSLAIASTHLLGNMTNNTISNPG